MGSSEILLVDHEFVQSRVLTQAIVSQLEQLPLLEMGINANDCGIVKWRETVLVDAWDPCNAGCATIGIHKGLVMMR
jgi:hypothetical protein